MRTADEESRLVRVTAIQKVALDTLAFHLSPADGRPLPPYTAGAHIDVQVPCGLTRQYSLCGDPADRSGYRIAVKREAQGRGGSISLHDQAEVGIALGIVGPRNHFPLHERATRHLFIAGGIGITPIHSMIHTLQAQGQDWALHYCARSRAHAAFYEELVALGGERVTAHFSEWPSLDVAALLSEVSQGTHVYCCGPKGLMQAVQSAAGHWPEGRLHFEWFAAPETDWPANQPFEVRLARANRSFMIPADQSILAVLREGGIRVPCACEEGVCGTCETAVLEGQPQHRDSLLSPEERAEGRTMMICVSRAHTTSLVLDL